MGNPFKEFNESVNRFKTKYEVIHETQEISSANYKSIKELEEAFTENGISNIVHNNPFKGGAITQYLFNVKDLDVIQLEINGRFRSMEHIDNLELLCNALMDFINRYIESIIREKE